MSAVNRNLNTRYSEMDIGALAMLIDPADPVAGHWFDGTRASLQGHR